MKADNLIQNIAQNIIFDVNSVGQLAKSNFPTEKPNKIKPLQVSRQAKNISPAHSRRYIYKISDFSYLKYCEKEYKIYKSVEEDFLQTIPLIFNELENIKIIFHNYNYQNEILDKYSKEEAFLFFEWVKTFAIMRQSNRKLIFEKILLTVEDDFLRTFRLFKIHKLKNKKKTIKEKVFDLIYKHYPYKIFSATDLYPFTNEFTAKRNVRSVLSALKDEKVLRKYKVSKKASYYNVIY